MRSAFTLIELLVVIGIMGVLASIVIIAIDPLGQLSSAQNAQREMRTKEIKNAIMQYVIGEGLLPGDKTIPTSLAEALPICAPGITDDSCVDLQSYLVSTYLPLIPTDDSETNSLFSGFKVYLQGGIEEPTVIAETSSGGGGGSIPVTAWLTHFGDTTGPGDNSGNDICRAVSVDSSGNVYCAGFTSGDMAETNGVGNDAIVMKLDSSGNVTWVTQLGDTTGPGDNSGSDTCMGVAVDSSGNVYCAGYTTGSVGETNAGNNDAFVMKLDSSGNVTWVTQLGDTTGPGDNTAQDYCQGVAVDSSGNVYCAGYSTGAIGETNGGGLGDIFIMKLDSSGNVTWVTQLGDTTGPGDNSGTDYSYDVAVDSSGNVYATGRTTGGLGETHGGGTYDAYIIKLDSSGNVTWVTQLGDTTGPGDNSGSDQCNGVAVDSSGNVYCAGGSQGAIGETNGGSADAFILKLDSSGNVTWVTQLGDTTGPGDNSGSDYCNAVSVDSSGNVYCAGFSRGGMGETNGGQHDVAVIKLDSSGNVTWVTQLGDTTGPGDNSDRDACDGVTVDSVGNVYCAGWTRGGIGETHGGGTTDAFIIKLDSSGTSP